MAADENVSTIAGQLKWLGLAALILGALVVLIGDDTFGLVLAVVGVVLYLSMQYLAARYQD